LKDFCFFIILEEMAKRVYLGNLELMVMLALLRLGDDAYGVPISREIEEITDREVALGSIYATLERLEAKGLVSSKLGESTPERGGRAKRYFRVTLQGLREIRETQRVIRELCLGLPQLEGGAV
jgi:PadR family transcriptional regulator, regulatory protein PadR